MVILEEIASHFLTFAKMNPIDQEKLKIAVEAHYKLQKSKDKSDTFNTTLRCLIVNTGLLRATHELFVKTRSY